MGSLVRQAEWHAQPTQMNVTDKLTVRNLEVTVNAGVDVWGREKKQRALVTVTLSFARPIDSAAEADTLDSSTVHYGILSKNLRSSLQNDDARWVSTFRLAELIFGSVCATAGPTSMRSLEVEIFYPKGSMLGEGAGFSHSINLQGPGTHASVLYLRNVKVPCLIGINSNERLQKQPAVVSVWIDCLPKRHCDAYPHLEYQAISNSSFETLESLSTMVVQELRENFFTSEEDQGAYIRLRVEKPHAVQFADAPAIEIVRPARV